MLLAWDGSRFSFDIGGLLIAGACLAWGVDNNLTRKLSSADPVQIAMIKGIVAGGEIFSLHSTLERKCHPRESLPPLQLSGFSA